MRIAFGNGAEPAKFTYLPVATRLHQHADVARGSGLNSNGFFLKKNSCKHVFGCPFDPDIRMCYG